MEKYQRIILFFLVFGFLGEALGQEFKPGEMIWELKPDDDSFAWDTSPAIGSDGTIYAHSDKGYLYAINRDGSIKWRSDFVCKNGLAAIGSDGTIYAHSDRGYIYAIASDGIKKWEFKTANEGPSYPVREIFPAIGSDGTIYFGDKGYVYAINPDGSKKWKFKFSTNYYVTSAPAIGADGTIYIGVNYFISRGKKSSSYLYAISSDGSRKWKFQTFKMPDGNQYRHSIGFSPAIGIDGTIYVCSFNKKLYAIKPNGIKKWEFETVSSVCSSPIIGSDGTIYLGTGYTWILNNPRPEYLLAISPDGIKNWQRNVEGDQEWNGTEANPHRGSSPAIGNDGTIYIGSGRKFYMINPDGTIKWISKVFPRDEEAVSSPAIGGNGSIYIASGGKLKSLKTFSTGPADSQWPMLGQNSRRTGSLPIPFISEQLSPHSTICGNAVEFKIQITGAGPFKYQWLKEDIPVSESITSSFNIDSVTAADSGNYSVVVSNVFGEVKSSSASLVVREPKVLGISISKSEIIYGEQSSISVTHEFVPPAKYQWKKNGVVISETTVPTLDISPATGTDSGDYSVIVSNDFSSAESEQVKLMVRLPEAAKVGERKWEFYLRGRKPTTSISIGNNGFLYFGDGRYIYALDKKTGIKKWIQAGKNNSSLAIGNDGTVYVGLDNSRIYALEGASGEKKWEFKARGAVRSSPAIANDGTIYFGSDDSRLYALKLDGTKKWEFRTGSRVSSSPAIGDDGTVYVGSWDSNIYAIKPDGSKKWSLKTAGRITNSSPAIGSDGTIYIGSDDGKIYAIDKEPRKFYVNGVENYEAVLKWEFQTGGAVKSSPAIGINGDVYIGSNSSKMYSLDGQSGVRKWEHNFNKSVYSSPIVGSDGIVYYGSYNKKFVALNGVTGAKNWEYVTKGNVRFSPAIDSDGTIYFGSEDRKVYALKTSSTGPANSSWPMFGQNARRTSNLLEKKNPPSSATISIAGAISTLPNELVYRETGDFRISHGGLPPFSYQWKKNGTDIQNATKSSFVIASAKASDAGEYSVVVGNENGKVESSKFILSVREPKVLDISFSNAEIIYGDGTKVFVSHELVPPVNYQWKKDGVNIPESNTPTLDISPATASDSGAYSVEVSNGFSEAQSLPINLVVRAPKVSITIANAVIPYEKRTNISVSHEFVLPVTYKWKKDGVVIPEATASILDIGPAKASDSGAYSVVVSNVYGDIESAPVLFTARPYIDGEMKWAFKIGAGGRGVTSAAIGSDGTIYIGFNDFILFAINPDGSKKWTIGLGKRQSPPTIGSDGSIYVGSGDNIYAINSDGSKKWAFKTDDYVFSSPAIGSDGTIYVGSSDNNLYAINPDGSKKWILNTGDVVSSSPAIGSDGTIYVGSTDMNFYAINPDGSKKWIFNTANVVTSSPAVGSDGIIYVGSNDSKLYAINPDGSKKWAFKTGGGVSSSPAIGSDGVIYVGSDDFNLYAINPDGSKKWAFKTGGKVASSPAIGSDGAIYVASRDYYLYAVDPDGSNKWKIKTGKWVLTSPAIGSDGTMYIGSHDDKLYAIQTSSIGLTDDSSWSMFRQNARHTGRLDTKPPTIQINQSKQNPNLIIISFKDLSGKTYTLQSSPDLLSWQSLDDEVPQTDEVGLTLEPTDEKTFYRLKLNED